MVEKLNYDIPRAPVRETERPVVVSEKPKANEQTARSVQEVQKTEPPAPERVEQTVSRMNEFLQEIQRDLKFTVNEETGHVVVTVTNPETNEIIRQIPPEEVLSIAERLQDGEDGFFIQEKV